MSFTRKRLPQIPYSGNTDRDFYNFANTVYRHFLDLEAKGALVIGQAQLYVDQGLQFPTTQVASTDTRNLDDYNETNWMPAGNGVTYGSSSGVLTKIGRQFFAHFDVVWPATADGGEARITGLPYTLANATLHSGALGFTDYGSADVLLRGVANTTYGALMNHSGATLTNANVSGKRFSGVIIGYV